MVTWGGDALSADHNQHTVAALRGQLLEICATAGAFAALTRGGAVVAWGDGQFGGEIPARRAADLGGSVLRLCSTEQAFAALKSSGQIIAWGDAGCGGDDAPVQAELQRGVDSVCSSDTWLRAGQPFFDSCDCHA